MDNRKNGVCKVMKKVFVRQFMAYTRSYVQLCLKYPKTIDIKIEKLYNVIIGGNK